MRPDYDMFLWGWVGDVDPNFLLSISTTGQIGGWNQSDWSDPEYDRLFTQQQQELDPQKRKQLDLADGADPLRAGAASSR